MKYISVSNVNRQLQENFRNFLPLKFLMLSLCRRSEIDYGTVKSDYSALVLVKSILDYYLMSKSFLQEQGYKAIYDADFSKRNLDKSITTKFVRSLQRKKFKARDYQIDAIHTILESHRGLILSPTGSGKSFIIYALTRYYVKN